jgi:hypothetical protein
LRNRKIKFLLAISPSSPELNSFSKFDSGHTEMIVTATGMETEIGRSATFLAQTGDGAFLTAGVTARR